MAKITMSQLEIELAELRGRVDETTHKVRNVDTMQRQEYAKNSRTRKFLGELFGQLETAESRINVVEEAATLHTQVLSAHSDDISDNADAIDNLRRKTEVDSGVTVFAVVFGFVIALVTLVLLRENVNDVNGMLQFGWFFGWFLMSTAVAALIGAGFSKNKEEDKSADQQDHQEVI